MLCWPQMLGNKLKIKAGDFNMKKLFIILLTFCLTTFTFAKTVKIDLGKVYIVTDDEWASDDALDNGFYGRSDEKILEAAWKMPFGGHLPGDVRITKVDEYAKTYGSYSCYSKNIPACVIVFNVGNGRQLEMYYSF